MSLPEVTLLAAGAAAGAAGALTAAAFSPPFMFLRVLRLRLRLERFFLAISINAPENEVSVQIEKKNENGPALPKF